MTYQVSEVIVIDDNRNANNLNIVQQTGAQPFWLNKANITSSYTVPTGYNAMTIGPVTVDNGVTVTINPGDTWVIV